MTVRQNLHQLVDELPDGYIDEVSRYVDDLRATEIDEEPLSTADLASIKSGLEDIGAGRVKSLDDYKRERKRMAMIIAGLPRGKAYRRLE
jgi:hypothetical protein